jgi:hypothetical protein
MPFFKKKRLRKKKKKKKEKPVKFDVHKRIEKLKEKFRTSGLKAQNDFFNLFKHFFKQYFRIKYHFTYEEFNHEIRRNKKLDKQLRQDIIGLSSRLSNVEYGSKELSRNELEFMMANFETLVNKLLEAKKEKKPKPKPWRVFTPFIKLKQRVVNAYTSRKTRVSKVVTQTREELRKRNLEHLNELIAQTQEALRNNDAKKARGIYSDMRKLFDKLPVEDRRSKYKRIMDLYERIAGL